MQNNRKQMSRFASIVLVVLMLVSLYPMSAGASDVINLFGGENEGSIEAQTDGEDQPGSETPISSETPAGSETPISSETPAGSETPTSTETPAGSETPTSSETPISSETPAGTETPAGSETPISSETPAGSETPTATETPIMDDDPVVDDAMLLLEEGNASFCSIVDFTITYSDTGASPTSSIPTGAEGALALTVEKSLVNDDTNLTDAYIDFTFTAATNDPNNDIAFEYFKCEYNVPNVAVQSFEAISEPSHEYRVHLNLQEFKAGEMKVVPLAVIFENGVTPDDVQINCTATMYETVDGETKECDEKTVGFSTDAKNEWLPSVKSVPTNVLIPEYNSNDIDKELAIAGDGSNLAGPEFTFTAHNNMIASSGGSQQGTLYTDKLCMEAQIYIPAYAHPAGHACTDACATGGHYKLSDFTFSSVVPPSMTVETMTVDASDSNTNNFGYVTGWPKNAEKVEYHVYKFVWDVENESIGNPIDPSTSVDMGNVVRSITINSVAIKPQDALFTNASDDAGIYGVGLPSRLILKTQDVHTNALVDNGYAGSGSARSNGDNYTYVAYTSKTYGSAGEHPGDTEVPFRKNVANKTTVFDSTSTEELKFELLDFKNVFVQTSKLKSKNLETLSIIDGYVPDEQNQVWKNENFTLSKIDVGSYYIHLNSSTQYSLMARYTDLQVKIYTTTSDNPYGTEDWDQLGDAYPLFGKNDSENGYKWVTYDPIVIANATDITGVKWEFSSNDGGTIPPGFGVNTSYVVTPGVHFKPDGSVPTGSYINNATLTYQAVGEDKHTIDSKASVYYHKSTDYIVNTEKTVISNAVGTNVFEPGSKIGYCIKVTNETKGEALPLSVVKIIDTPDKLLVDPFNCFGDELTASYQIYNKDGSAVENAKGEVKALKQTENGVSFYEFTFPGSSLTLGENQYIQLNYSIVLPTAEQLKDAEHAVDGFAARNRADTTGTEEGNVIILDITSTNTAEVKLGEALPHFGIDKQVIDKKSSYIPGEQVTYELTLNHYSGAMLTSGEGVESYFAARDMLPNGLDLTHGTRGDSAVELFSGEKTQAFLDSLVVTHHSANGDTTLKCLNPDSVVALSGSNTGFAEELETAAGGENPGYYVILDKMEWQNYRCINYFFSKLSFEAGDTISIRYTLPVGEASTDKPATDGDLDYNLIYFDGAQGSQQSKNLWNTLQLYLEPEAEYEYVYLLTADGESFNKGTYRVYLPDGTVKSYDGSKTGVLEDKAYIAVSPAKPQVSLRKTLAKVEQRDDYYYYKFRITIKNTSEQGSDNNFIVNSGAYSTLYDRIPANHELMAGVNNSGAEFNTSTYFIATNGAQYPYHGARLGQSIVTDDRFQSQPSLDKSYGSVYRFGVESFKEGNYTGFLPNVSQQNGNNNDAAILHPGEGYSLEYWTRIHVGLFENGDQNMNYAAFYATTGIANDTCGHPELGYGQKSTPKNDTYFFGDKYGTNDTQTTTDDYEYLRAYAIVDYDKAKVVPDIQKTRVLCDKGKISISPSTAPYYPGSTVYWMIEASNLLSSASALNGGYQIVDLLPSTLTYKNSWLLSSKNPLDFTAAHDFKAQESENKLTWTMADPLDVGENAYILVETQLNDTYGTTVNPAYLIPADHQPMDWQGKVEYAKHLTSEETLEILGVEAEALATEAYVNVFGVYEIVSYKEVVDAADHKNMATSQYQKADYITLDQGKDFIYNLIVETSSKAYSFKELTVIDVLPYIGDTGVLVTQSNRGSQWVPALKDKGDFKVYIGKTELEADEYTIQYSSAKSGFDDADWSNDVDVTTTADWKTDIPDGGASSIRVVVSPLAGIITSDHPLKISFTMNVPMGTEPNITAWNSFGYSVTPDKGSGTAERFEAEPIKVGVKTGENESEISISGKKVWVDDDNQSGKRPPSIVIVVEKPDGKGGKAVVAQTTVTENDTNEWAYSFTGLKEYENGEKIQYSVREKEVSDGYTASVAGYTITNTLKKTDKISLALEAKKIAENGKLTDKQFGFALYENSKEISVGTNDASGKITFTPIEYTTAGTHTYEMKETSKDGNGWTVDKTVYTVVVTVKEEGGELSVSSTTVDGDAEKVATFTNKYTSQTPTPTPPPTPTPTPPTTPKPPKPPTCTPKPTPTPTPPDHGKSPQTGEDVPNWLDVAMACTFIMGLSAWAIVSKKKKRG